MTLGNDLSEFVCRHLAFQLHIKLYFLGHLKNTTCTRHFPELDITIHFNRRMPPIVITFRPLKLKSTFPFTFTRPCFVSCLDPPYFVLSSHSLGRTLFTLLGIVMIEWNVLWILARRTAV